MQIVHIQDLSNPRNWKATCLRTNESVAMLAEQTDGSVQVHRAGGKSVWFVGSNLSAAQSRLDAELHAEDCAAKGGAAVSAGEYRKAEEHYAHARFYINNLNSEAGDTAPD